MIFLGYKKRNDKFKRFQATTNHNFNKHTIEFSTDIIALKHYTKLIYITQSKLPSNFACDQTSFALGHLSSLISKVNSKQPPCM